VTSTQFCERGAIAGAAPFLLDVCRAWDYPQHVWYFNWLRPVSTLDQDLTTQGDNVTALVVAPVRIYVDQRLTGTNRDRPGLREALAAIAGAQNSQPELSPSGCGENGWPCEHA
jgi:hypothetical protein